MTSQIHLSARQPYDEWHSRYPVDAEADTPWHRMIRAHISSEHDFADKRVLEIGCGRGGLSCWLAQQPHPPRQIVAADLSLTAVQKGAQHARALGIPGVTWEVGDIQAIAHPDASMDAIISCETVEHVLEPRSAIAELSRVLKPGGRLFLTTPNYLGTMGLYRLYSRLRGRVFTEEGQPINRLLFLPVTLYWVRRTGLSVVLINTVGHYLPFPGRPPIEMPVLERVPRVTRWFGFHTLIVAAKPLA
jgi:2-polyprenyl-3-methyl-5-hydroxy-6-metoxy-1,4-benzoquinol methylase